MPLPRLSGSACTRPSSRLVPSVSGPLRPRVPSAGRARARHRRQADRTTTATATSSPRSATTTRATSRRRRQLIRAAKECGVDAVKLQKRDNRIALHARVLRRAVRQREQLRPDLRRAPRGAGARRDDWRRAARLRARAGHRRSSRRAFDAPSADFLAELDMPAFKIASGDLVNTPLLRHVAALRQADVRLAPAAAPSRTSTARSTPILPLNPQLCVLQCTASYPADVEELNLGVIETLPRALSRSSSIGLSDHQNGIAMALVAYMLGARVIEKHFTLNHAWKGTDHAFSLMPEGMRQLVRDLRRVPGRDRRRRQAAAARARNVRCRRWGRSSSRRAICRPGMSSTPGDIVAKSPADGGLPPYELDRLLGRRLLAATAVRAGRRARGPRARRGARRARLLDA